jgi:hypothetical protein
VIILSLCNTCLTRFKILVEPSKAHLLRQISSEDGVTAACPRLCGGRINLTGGAISRMAKNSALRESMNLTVEELYKAVSGAGLPDEIVKDPDTIRALLKANKIVDVGVEKDGEDFYIHELLLDNKLIVHLGTGLRGARVVKITKEYARASGNNRRSRSKARTQG